MAKKLPLRERAKIRLGDLDYTEKQLQDMMAKVAAEDEELAADVPREKPALKEKTRKASTPRKKTPKTTDKAPQETPKAGRPTKADAPRDKIFSLRLTEAHYWKLKEIAAKEHCTPADLIERFIELHER